MGKKRSLIIVVVFILLGSASVLYPVEFYEKSDIQKRMEKREVISVVKLTTKTNKKEHETLKMLAAAVVDGISVHRAMEVMSDYDNLQNIAPEYIKKSELFVRRKQGGGFQKYLHMTTEVKTILTTYSIEIYATVREEEIADRAIVHWEIVPASTIGRKLKREDFVGMKGQIVVRKYKRTKHLNSHARPVRRGGKGYHRSRPKKNQLMVLFKGIKSEGDVSKLVPNIFLKFAMEFALQRVGILLRNYLETAKTKPAKKDLAALADEEEKNYPMTPTVKPASPQPASSNQ